MKIVLLESQYIRIIEQKIGRSKLRIEKFLEKSKEQKRNVDINGDHYLYDSIRNFVDGTTPVEGIKCKVHGEFSAKPSKHMVGVDGCPICAKLKKEKNLVGAKKRHNAEDLRKEALKYKTDAEFKKSSPNIRSAARKFGKRTGNENFYKDITSHFVPEKESAGENLVAKILIENNLLPEICITRSACRGQQRESKIINCKSTKGQKSESQKLTHLLSFDFYLKDLNLVIEYDGEQHFKPVNKFGGYTKFIRDVEHDLEKKDCCKKNDINMIRIPYTLNGDDIRNQLISAIQNKNNKLQLLGNYPKKGWNDPNVKDILNQYYSKDINKNL